MGSFLLWHWLILLAFFVVFLFIFFLPTIIATKKGHSFSLWFFVNILVGWSVIGWFIALFVAITRKPTAKAKGMRECPKCIEPVKRMASVCKHCGNDIALKYLSALLMVSIIY